MPDHVKQAGKEPVGGAYGVRFYGHPGLRLFRADPPVQWPLWRVMVERAVPAPAEGMDVEPDRARVAMLPTGQIYLDRHDQTIRFVSPQPLSEAAVAHPGLAVPAGVIAWWLGRAVVHASAVVIDGRAWGFLGERGAGKSTTAAMLVEAGHPLLSDDVVVVETGRAFAGPSSIDLRAEAGQAFGAEDLGVIGTRERWRLTAPTTPWTVPMGGWVALSWGGSASVERIPPELRLPEVSAGHAFPLAPETLLDLLAMPMFRFRRPPGLGSARDTLALLVETLRAG